MQRKRVTSGTFTAKTGAQREGNKHGKIVEVE